MLNLKKMFLLLCFSFLSVFFLIGQVSAASLSFVTSSDTIAVGETVQVDILVSGLVDVNLASFKLAIDYDYPILELASHDFGAYLSSSPSFSTEEGSDYATIMFSSTVDYSEPITELVLASLTFTGGSVGECWLTFGVGDLFSSGSDDNPMFTEFSSAIITVTDTVAPVPEPATMILLGTGLMGLAFSRKKRTP